MKKYKKKCKWLNGYMVKWLKKFVVFLLLMLPVICYMLHAPFAYAAIDWLGTGCAVNEPINIGGNIEYITVVTIKGLECIFSQVLNIIARIAGLAVFVMIIIGGWQYIGSGGDKQAVEKARKTLTYAVLGLVLLIGSWFILRFIKVFTGVEVTNFVVGD